MLMKRHIQFYKQRVKEVIQNRGQVVSNRADHPVLENCNYVNDKHMNQRRLATFVYIAIQVGMLELCTETNPARVTQGVPKTVNYQTC